MTIISFVPYCLLVLTPGPKANSIHKESGQVLIEIGLHSLSVGMVCSLSLVGVSQHLWGVSLAVSHLQAIVKYQTLWKPATLPRDSDQADLWSSTYCNVTKTLLLQQSWRTLPTIQWYGAWLAIFCISKLIQKKRTSTALTMLLNRECQHQP